MLFGGCAVFVLSMGALAQGVPEPVTVPAPLFDPQQLPTQRGQVQQFTLNPRGDIDGLILTDGTEVKTPPHLSTEIAYSVKPGDTITIHGLRAAALPLVQAVSITDEASGRMVVDNGPPGPRRGPAGPAAAIPAPTEVQGRIRMALHGRRGEINGALLEDGTVLRLPPPEAERLAALLQSGQTVVVEGTAFVNPLGKVLEVRRLGPSRDQLNQVQGPPGPGGKKGRRGPPPPA
jgi:hypothetical protein